ncbi:FliM/FliN family flagellar motor switch protein [Qipengyuania sp. DGS5-3]|uniref:FliM/FliN family flagellar motor switch protein n=1 Tax=Qipengyuania sp. DGS5-3 TaxID=3349632 RepID=UPI0036D410AF
MKPYHNFDDARVLAQHCPQLLTHGVKQQDTGALALRFADQLASDLPARLRPLLIGAKPLTSFGEASKQTVHSLMQEIGTTATNFAVAVPGTAVKLLLSFDNATAISLTDRLFGGTGKVDAEIEGSAPAKLSLSATLALERIVDVFASAAAEQMETPVGGDERAEERASAVHFDSDETRITGFPRGEDCLAWTFTIAQEGFDDWGGRLAVLESALIAAGGSGNAADETQAPLSFGAAARQHPFEDVPLELTAILAEMRLPIARVYALARGDILPLAPRRNVPLKMGQETIGHGSIGALDERVALQLTGVNYE